MTSLGKDTETSLELKRLNLETLRYNQRIESRTAVFANILDPDQAEIMNTVKEQFVVDESGNRTAVLLDLEEYSKLLEAKEELESIRAFDEAKSSGDEANPFSQAIREIESRPE